MIAQSSVAAAQWLIGLLAAAHTGRLVLRNRTLRDRIEAAESGHLLNLDGLRAILALSVFVQHAGLNLMFVRAGLWGPPPTSFQQVLGVGSVMIFFMITGFLFWSRAIGKPGSLRALPFYRSRFLRIYPAFLASIVALLAIVAIQTHFHLNEPVVRVLKETGRQLLLGFSSGDEINGLANANLINGDVTWSLAYEAVFYALLPIAAFFVQKRWRMPVALVFILLACRKSYTWLPICFVAGFIAAEIYQRPRIAATLAAHAAKIAIVSLCVLVLDTFLFPLGSMTASRMSAPVFMQCLALAGIFFGVIFEQKKTFLARIEFRYLGSISYSIYLWHVIVLYAVTHLVLQIVPVASISSAAYWMGVFIICIPLIVGIATCSYFFFELPYMRPTKVSVRVR